MIEAVADIILRVDIQLLIVISITIDFLLILFLTWLNRGIFVDLFKSISSKSKIILLLIAAIFSILVILKGVSFREFIPSDQEWELMRQAMELSTGGQIFDQLRYGMVYPFILSFGFLIFGVNPLVGSVLTFVFGILSIFLVFIISQVIFNNEKINLISTGMYAISPLFYIFTTLQMGYPGLVNFFILLFVLASVLSFKKHKTSLFALSLLLIVILSQIKPEYFVITVPYVLFFIFSKEYKRYGFASIFLLMFLFVTMLFPYIIQNAHFKEFYSSSGWCGDGSLVGNTPVYSNVMTNLVDPVIKFLANDRFSINYFINKIPSYIQFWLFRSLVVVTLVVILGIVVALKKQTKLTLYVLAIFVSINALYLSDCFVYDTRYAFPTFGLIVIFFGVGINYLLNLVSGGDKSKRLINNVLLILFSVLMMIFFYFYEYKSSLFKGYYYDYLWVKRSALYISDSSSAVKLLVSDLPKENTYILVPHPNDKNILMMMGYKSLSLADYIVPHNNEAINFDLVNIPLNFNINNYFMETQSCYDPGIKEKCDYIKEKYFTKVIKSIDANDSLYSLDQK